MSFKATLEIDNKTYDLQECRWNLHQEFNQVGEPKSGVYAGLFKIIMYGTEHNNFSSWVGNPKKIGSGTITLNRIDQESKFKELKFENSYLIHYVESFLSPGQLELDWDDFKMKNDDIKSEYKIIINHQLRTGTSYVIYCVISAEKITIDGTMHDNRWDAFL
jgi:hypothetical protein